MADKKPEHRKGTEIREGLSASGDPEGTQAERPGGDLAFPVWVPAVLYGAVTLLLFRKFVFTGQMLYGSDTLSLGFVARDFFAQALRQGFFPLWNPIILGGTPFLDSLAGGDSLYPTSALLFLMEPYRALGWKLVLHVFLAGLFTYGWIRALGRSRAAALLSGLAYLMAPFMVTLVFPGSDGKLFVTALTPLLFWATERALAGGRLRAFAALALVVTLVILTTHFQQAYFLFGAVGVYAFIRVLLLWRGGLGLPWAAGRFALFLAFSGVGAGVSAVQLLPAVEYVTHFSRRTATTTRASQEGSVAYSSSWSLHPEEIAALVVPEFVGASVQASGWTANTYWGRNVFKLNHEYGGLVVLLLAVVAFFGAPGGRLRFTLLGIGVVALLYALGAHTPVWRAFYEVVPGISLFRAPSIAAFLFGFAAVTLMAFGIDRVLDLGGPGWGDDAGPESKSGGRRASTATENKGIRIFLVAVTGILLLGAVLASSGALTSAWVSVLYSGIEPGKAQALARAQPYIARGFFLATLLSAATLALVWGFQKGKVPRAVWVGAVGLLLVFDLARVDDPFIQTMDFQAWAAPDPNIQYLEEQQRTEAPFRILAMGGQQAGSGQDVKPGMYGLELAAGHHPNDLARYRELIGMAGSGVPMNFFDSEGRGLNLPLLSILNVRYVIWPVYQFGGLPQGEAVMATTLGGGRPYEAVYEIPTLPRARLVKEVVVLPEEQTMEYILSPAFRPREEIVLNEAPELRPPPGPAEGDITWLEKTPNRLRLRVRSVSPAFLVVADNWYPAWRARIGDQDAPVLRANLTLRAVPVPAGENEVEIYYDAGVLRLPLFVSLASLLVLGVLAWIGGRRKVPRPSEGPSGAGETPS